MKAVILAGGLGTRLRPFTQIVPKPLLPIGEQSVLEIQIGRLKEYGFDHIIFATNYKANYVARFFGDGSDLGVRITYSKEETALGTAGPLSLLKSQLKEPFLLMNGDILTLMDFRKFYEFALSKNELLTVAIKQHVTPFAFGNIFSQGDYVTSIEEKQNIVRYILAGIYIMQPAILDLIPQGEVYGIDTLINSMLAKKMPVVKYEFEEYWLDIGQISDYENSAEIYERYFRVNE
ncbi:MAG TPA: sugar phosphate nucleotidyltransferase [Pirellulales bacterium]|nr:sugar phosphate nucleotidyltransferase [Pirellulales bacterium]